MEPTLENGSGVLISSLPFLFLRPKIGDIVASKKESKIFIKRVAKIKNDQYFLAGDNSKDSMDGWFNRNKIIGKVIFVSRYNLL